MKEFLLKTGLYLLLLAILHLAAVFLADDEADPLYVKVASKPSKSLIIGSSRAAQGIVPEILDSLVEAPVEKPFFNFAFSHVHSRYGPVYLRALKKKLDPETRQGLFLLVVDPAVISANRFYPEDTALFPERSTFVNTLKHIDKRPNLEFLLNEYPNAWGSLLLNSLTNPVKARDNGWIEVLISDDPASCQMRLGMKIKEYQQKYRINTFSHTRLDYLEKTIEFLQHYGKVVLVRLPVHPQLFALEKKHSGNFDEIIENLSRKYALPFLDYSEFTHQYHFTDGSHLTRKSARILSRRLAREINTVVLHTTIP